MTWRETTLVFFLEVNEPEAWNNVSPTIKDIMGRAFPNNYAMM